MFCQKCGAKNPENNLFCQACGERLPMKAPPTPAQRYPSHASMDMNPPIHSKIGSTGLIITIAVLAVALIVAGIYILTSGSLSTDDREIADRADHDETVENIVIDGETIVPKDDNGNIVEPLVIDGTVYLPAHAICEAFGYNVEWDETTNTVYIYSPPTDGFVNQKE